MVDNTLEAERLSIEREKLKLERQKLAVETQLKRRELADRQSKSFKELLANPLALAIAGGFITLMTTIITTWYTANENRKSEDWRSNIAQKSAQQALQSELIKKFVEAPKTETVRENLRFLVDAGLLPNYAEGITKYLKENPDAAPAVGSTLVGGVVGDTDQRVVLGSAAGADARKFQGVGQIETWLGGVLRSGCTGFLIAPGIVVTADYCFGNPIDVGSTATFKPLSRDNTTAAKTFEIDLERRVFVKGPAGSVGIIVVPLKSADFSLLSYLSLANESPKEGQPLETAFFALDRGWVYSAGSNCRAIAVEVNQIRHLCDTGSGSSGAPLLSAAGIVVGVHTGLDAKNKKAFRADLIRSNPEVRKTFGDLPTQVQGQSSRP